MALERWRTLGLQFQLNLSHHCSTRLIQIQVVVITYCSSGLILVQNGFGQLLLRGDVITTYLFHTLNFILFLSRKVNTVFTTKRITLTILWHYKEHPMLDGLISTKKAHITNQLKHVEKMNFAFFKQNERFPPLLRHKCRCQKCVAFGVRTWHIFYLSHFENEKSKEIRHHDQITTGVSCWMTRWTWWDQETRVHNIMDGV